MKLTKERYSELIKGAEIPSDVNLHYGLYEDQALDLKWLYESKPNFFYNYIRYLDFNINEIVEIIDTVYGNLERVPLRFKENFILNSPYIGMSIFGTKDVGLTDLQKTKILLETPGIEPLLYVDILEMFRKYAPKNDDKNIEEVLKNIIDYFYDIRNNSGFIDFLFFYIRLLKSEVFHIFANLFFINYKIIELPFVSDMLETLFKKLDFSIIDNIKPGNRKSIQVSIIRKFNQNLNDTDYNKVIMDVLSKSSKNVTDIKNGNLKAYNGLVGKAISQLKKEYNYNLSTEDIEYLKECFEYNINKD
jgi:hypothetical protein